MRNAKARYLPCHYGKLRVGLTSRTVIGINRLCYQADFYTKPLRLQQRRSLTRLLKFVIAVNIPLSGTDPRVNFSMMRTLHLSVHSNTRPHQPRVDCTCRLSPQRFQQSKT